jgi:AcrR family transcriptional regulator
MIKTKTAAPIAATTAKKSPGRQPAGGVSSGIRAEISNLRRERIVAEAVQLFDAKGFSHTTLDEVGDRMGVTKPFIYLHFKSKGELLAEISGRGIRASLEVINRIANAEGTPTEKLKTLVRDFTRQVIQNQPYISIYNREEKHLSPEDAEVINTMRRQFDRMLTTLLESGVKTGEFQIDDHRIASLAIGGVVSWVHVWYRAGGRLDADETSEALAELMLSMVRSPRVRARPAAERRKRP